MPDSTRSRWETPQLLRGCTFRRCNPNYCSLKRLRNFGFLQEMRQLAHAGQQLRQKRRWESNPLGARLQLAA